MSSINLADNRSFLARSAGPKTMDRSIDLFPLFRLDLRPLAMPLDCVRFTPQFGVICSVSDDSVVLLR